MNKEMLNKHIKQFMGYFFVGGIASVVDYCLANAMYLFLKHVVALQSEMLLQNVSALLGILAGLIVNYFMALKFVFHSEKSLKDFLQVCLITGVSCLIILGMTAVNVKVCHLPFAFFKVVTMGVAFIWNYLARSLWVYNKKEVDRKAA